MSRLLDERERAAENLYAHDQELIFLARRRGVQVLANWAAEAIGLTAEASLQYEQKLVDAFVAGTPEDQLVESVQTELESAGRRDVATNAGARLAQAVADAQFALRGQPSRGPASAETPREEWARNHPKPGHSWGWGL